MVSTLGYFEGSGIFADAADDPGGDAAERLTRPVESIVADLYDNVADSCLRRAEGDQQKADYLFDCSYFEYYYRIRNYNRYIDFVKKNKPIT